MSSTKFAMPVTEEMIDMAEQLVGERLDMEGVEPMFIRMERVGPLEFHIKWVTEAQILEEYKDDPELVIIGKQD